MPFETASLLVALGGDSDNTVPRDNATAAEVAVLQTIHGLEAITDVVVSGSVPHGARAEMVRLREVFKNTKTSDGKQLLVDSLFPGANPRLFETFAELQLVPQQYKDPNKAPKQLDDDVSAAAAVMPLAAPAEDLDELESDDQPLAGALD